jgi:four helix bundle protein
MKRRLDEYGGFQKTNELFDLAVGDLRLLARDPICSKLVSQQIAAADSICANIEEGYGRGTRRDFVHFLDIARGSAREVRGRYHRLRHWLNPDIVISRESLCDEIIGILTATITKLRTTPVQK